MDGCGPINLTLVEFLTVMACGASLAVAARVIWFGLTGR